MGGIKEKLIGALRAGVKTVLLPAQNRKEVKDLPQEVRDGLEIIHVRYVLCSFVYSVWYFGDFSSNIPLNSHVWEALGHVWPDAHWPGQEKYQQSFESRL